MLIFREIYETVSDRINKSDSAYQAKIKRWINSRYETAARRFPWRALVESRETGVTLTAGQSVLVLPKRVGTLFVVAEMTNKLVLDSIEFQALWRGNTSTINSQAQAIRYAHIGEVGSLLSLSVADTLEVLSSSASDGATRSVRIFGTVGGEDVSETITLNGTTAVDSANTYDVGTYIRVSKDADTTGVISVRENGTPSRILATLAQNEFTTTYKRVRLHRVPNSAPTVAIYYNKAVRRLVNDLDVPEFPCSQYLVAAAYVDALKEQQQFAKAQVQEGFAESELHSILAQESSEDQILQFQPAIRERF